MPGNDAGPWSESLILGGDIFPVHITHTTASDLRAVVQIQHIGCILPNGLHLILHSSHSARTNQSLQHPIHHLTTLPRSFLHLNFSNESVHATRKSVECNSDNLCPRRIFLSLPEKKKKHGIFLGEQTIPTLIQPSNGTVSTHDVQNLCDHYVSRKNKLSDKDRKKEA